MSTVTVNACDWCIHLYSVIPTQQNISINYYFKTLSHLWPIIITTLLWHTYPDL